MEEMSDGPTSGCKMDNQSCKSRVGCLLGKLSIDYPGFA